MPDAALTSNSPQETSREPWVICAWLAAWIGGFFFFERFGGLIRFPSREIAFLATTTVLVTLSSGFVIGFSRLALPRAFYLAIGALAIGLVFKAATPMIERTKTIDGVGQSLGKVFFLTLGASQISAGGFVPGIVARNNLYEKTSDFLEETFPESSAGIFLLCLSQLLLSSGIGLWIGNGIDKVGHLIPICLVAGLADIWSVSAGATAVIIRSSTIHYFLLRFPLIGGGGSAMPFLIGLSDFLFFGIFYQAANRFRLGTKKNVVLLGFSFFAAVCGAVFLKVGLPVLPFMAVLFVGGNYKHLKLDHQDLRDMLLFLGGVGVVAGIITFFMHK